MRGLLVFLIYLLMSGMVSAQTPDPKIKPVISAYDGVIAVGYVDHGAFLNFTGPNISATFQNHKVLIGMLPSLRIKEDKAVVKNSVVMPGLGVGLTYSYKKIILQLPVYYNAKTATANGRWVVGLGIGLRIKSR